jgi:hypothetical protein
VHVILIFFVNEYENKIRVFSVDRNSAYVKDVCCLRVIAFTGKLLKAL